MLYLFNHSEELVGELKRGELESAESIEELSGFTRIDFSILLEIKDKMDGVEFVAHLDRHSDTFYYYKLIIAGNKQGNVISYTGINIAFDDLRGYGYLEEYNLESTTAALALETILHGSRWQLRKAEDTPQKDLLIQDISRLEALSELIKVWDVELDFKVEISGNQITHRYVDLYVMRGRDTYQRYVYGHNALEVVKEENQSDIFTAAVGRGKSLETFDTSGESGGGFGKRIDFKDIKWSKEEGNPVDKPLGQDYVELQEATAKYGYSDGTPRFKIVEFSEIEDPLELLEATYKELVQGSRPLVQFKANIEALGKTFFLGDRVGIIRHDLDIYYVTRIFKVKRNLLNDLDITVELGDNLSYNQAQKNKSLVDQISNLNSRVTEVAKSANGTFIAVIDEMREGIANSYYNEDGYNYELKVNNEYGLPAGYYSFDKPIEENPTKVIYTGAGKMLIANKKDANGDWEWTTIGTGDGLMAEAIVGTLGEFAKVNAEAITVNNHFAATELGQKVVVQDELYNNVKITQAKGVQVLDNKSRERLQLGNWDTNRYGLKLVDASGNRTILDDQGIMQSWQVDKTDNIDSGYPMAMYVYIPPETARIYQAKMQIYVSSFRAHSKGADQESIPVYTTSGGGGYYYPTGGATRQPSSTSSYETSVEYDKSPRYLVEDGNINYNKWVVAWLVTEHQHRFTLPDHQHELRIDEHVHPLNIPAHGHPILYGIYEDRGSNRSMSIVINGTDRTSALTGSATFGYNQANLDVTSYLQRGQWNTVEIKAKGRARVDVSIFLQALLNYGGY